MEPELTEAEMLFYSLFEEDLKDDVTLPMCDLRDFSDMESLNDELFNSDKGNDHAVEIEFNMEEEEEPEGYKSKKIKPSKYDGADINQVIQSCVHISQDQQLLSFPRKMEESDGSQIFVALRRP